MEPPSTAGVLPPKPDADQRRLPATERRARRRAREISSRYMMIAPPSPSQIPSSSSSGDVVHFAPSPKQGLPPPLPRSLSHHPRPRRVSAVSIPSPDAAMGFDSEPASCFPDENHVPILNRNLTNQRRIKLFSDNGGGDQQQQNQEHPKIMDFKGQSRKTRPGTPTVSAVDRIGTPRLNLLSQKDHRSTNLRRIKSEPCTPARVNTCLIDDDIATRSLETSPESSVAPDSETCSVRRMGRFCESPPIAGSKARPFSDLRSSMPEADLLPTMSVRRKEGNEDSICHRSLNSALSSCQQIPFSVAKTVSRPVVSSRLSLKNSGPCLPPPPPGMKPGMELKKATKGSHRQEDIHLLQLLENRYLQWRFANAKAQAAVRTWGLAAERSLSNVSGKIIDIRDSVISKRIELEQLKRVRDLSSILEAQMPILDEWAMLKEDYSTSLSGAIKALQCASLRLPIIGNVRADFKEIGEVLESAINLLGGISPSLERFLPKAEGMENVISELARVIIKERSLVQECGDMLSEVHKLQVNECSLRSQLIQLKESTGACINDCSLRSQLVQLKGV